MFPVNVQDQDEQVMVERVAHSGDPAKALFKSEDGDYFVGTADSPSQILVPCEDLAAFGVEKSSKKAAAPAPAAAKS